VSVVANVAINVDSSGAVSKLRQVQQGAQATSQAVDKLNATNDALAASFTKSGKPIQTAANGMRFFTDATGRARKENGQFVTTAEAAAAGLQKQGKAAQQAGASVSNFGGTVRALLGSFALIQSARFVFAKTAELESQTRSLQVLTGSAEKAKQIIKDLQQLGAVTPFTSTELIDSAKRLQAFGVEADKVVETTKRLADVSGATGAELSGLVTAYGQVQAKGRLQGEELLQFQERGVALQTELRKMYGLSGEEFQKALEKGRIGSEAVEVAILRLTSVGGKYANGAIAQSDTLQGRLSTLQDGIDGLARGIGAALSPAIKAVLNEAIFAINLINQLIATGARAKSFGLGQDQRKQILNQAQSEAQQIVEGRRIKDPFKRNQQFQELVGQRERDLIESYGYRTGQVKAAVTATSMPAATPALLGGGGGGGGGAAGGGKRAADKAAREAERAAEAAAQEAARVKDVIRNRLAEGQIIAVKIQQQDRIAAAEAAGDKMLAARLQSQERELEIQYRYAQELAKEVNLDAQKAIIYEGLNALTANQVALQRELDTLQTQSDQDRLTSLQKAVEKQYELNTAVQNQLQLTDGVANTLGEGLGAAFNALIAGAQGWEKSLQQIASGVLVDIANQLIRIFVVEQAINAIKAFLTPFSASTPLGAGGGTVGKFGTLGPNYGIPQRAKGGPVSSGQTYMVGERGPELFVPGRSGTIVANDKMGGGSTNVVVNVDAKGSSVEGDDQGANQLGRVISAAVQSELIKQQRPGGILAR
jgi:tape measure domain-containing protein